MAELDQKLENIIHLIEESPLDQTIKDILIRDLKSEGLTEFLKEQIKAYCLDGIKKIDAQIEAAKKSLDEQVQNPSA